MVRFPTPTGRAIHEGSRNTPRTQALLGIFGGSCGARSFGNFWWATQWQWNPKSVKVHSFLVPSPLILRGSGSSSEAVRPGYVTENQEVQ